MQAAQAGETMTAIGSGASPRLAHHARLGRFVTLSAVLPLDDSGRVVAGGIREQTHRALERLGEAAAEAGVSLARAAAIHVYLRDAADFAAMNEAYAPFFPVDPPTRTTIVAPPVDRGALVAIAAVVVADGEPRDVVHPASWKPSVHPYSYGIRSGDTVFLSGLVSRRGRDGGAVDGDVTVQTGVVLDNARELLAAAGMSFADVVSARVYITAPAAFAAMNDVYREAFAGTPPPARATVVAGLMLPSLLVEITFVAVRDQARVVVGSSGPLPFSPAVGAGGRLFVAGMLGNSVGARVDTATETREIVARVGATLDQAGLGWGDVAEVLVYVTDAQLAGSVLGELARATPDGLPAGSVVQTALVVPDATVEVMVTARDASRP
jgi:enamine deaminase RidA (YjgF/YER057c/UK114 family)